MATWRDLLQNFSRAADPARVKGDRHRLGKEVDTGRIEDTIAVLRRRCTQKDEARVLMPSNRIEKKAVVHLPILESIYGLTNSRNASERDLAP
jgi:hypothetical protein